MASQRVGPRTTYECATARAGEAELSTPYRHRIDSMRTPYRPRTTQNRPRIDSASTSEWQPNRPEIDHESTPIRGPIVIGWTPIRPGIDRDRSRTHPNVDPDRLRTASNIDIKTEPNSTPNPPPVPDRPRSDPESTPRRHFIGATSTPHLSHADLGLTPYRPRIDSESPASGSDLEARGGALGAANGADRVYLSRWASNERKRVLYVVYVTLLLEIILHHMIRYDPILYQATPSQTS